MTRGFAMDSGGGSPYGFGFDEGPPGALFWPRDVNVYAGAVPTTTALASLIQGTPP
jgi:hypothetical protein